MTANFWNLIKFREVKTEEHGLQWLMRKDRACTATIPAASTPARRRARSSST